MKELFPEYKDQYLKDLLNESWSRLYDVRKWVGTVRKRRVACSSASNIATSMTTYGSADNRTWFVHGYAGRFTITSQVDVTGRQYEVLVKDDPEIPVSFMAMEGLRATLLTHDEHGHTQIWDDVAGLERINDIYVVHSAAATAYQSLCGRLSIR